MYVCLCHLLALRHGYYGEHPWVDALWFNVVDVPDCYAVSVTVHVIFLSAYRVDGAGIEPTSNLLIRQGLTPSEIPSKFPTRMIQDSNL